MAPETSHDAALAARRLMAALSGRRLHDIVFCTTRSAALRNFSRLSCRSWHRDTSICGRPWQPREGWPSDRMTPAATAPVSRAPFFDISIVTTLDQFNALADDWRDLLAHGANGAELFHDPAVIRLMLTDTSQSLSPAFVVVRHDDLIQCIAPFYVHRTNVPLRLSVIQLASFRARTLRLFGDSIIFRQASTPRTRCASLRGPSR